MRNKFTMTIGAVIAATLAFAQMDRPIQERELVQGVEVTLQTSEGMFPASWREEPINAKAEAVAEHEGERSMKLVKKALTYYPDELLKRAIKRIYVCGSIEFYGLQYGGTNSLDTVYLTNQGPDKGYTDAYIQSSFHHELSSIFLRNYHGFFNEGAWMKANPSDFKYGRGGTEALRTGKASIKYDSALAARGFLTEYSQASLEEDFNMIAEGLFSGNPLFWALVDENPKLEKKAKLALSFYFKLSSRFTEEYFRSLVPESKG